MIITVDGLNIDKNSIVAIHDGVRPFITKKLIKKLFKNAEKNKCVVPYIETNNTIILNKKYVTRKELMLIQTPQLFRSEIITKAYKQKYNNEFSDDSSVVKSQGNKINYLKGEKYNIKITTKEDLDFIEKII